MSVIASLLVLALIGLLSFWARTERRFKRYLSAAWPGPPAGQTGPRTGQPGQAETESWERRMAIRRSYERTGLLVSFGLAAVLCGFFWLSAGYYVGLVDDPTPPEIVLDAGRALGPLPGETLRWHARYPGGRLWPVMADGGYVLFRAVRGHFDQYLLYGAQGRLIWRGEVIEHGPAPRAAVGHADGCALLAVEKAGGARLLVLDGEGALLHDRPLDAFPTDGDPQFYGPKTSAGEMRVRLVSPDGTWQVKLGAGFVLYVGGIARVYGPPP